MQCFDMKVLRAINLITWVHSQVTKSVLEIFKHTLYVHERENIDKETFLPVLH